MVRLRGKRSGIKAEEFRHYLEFDESKRAVGNAISLPRHALLPPKIYQCDRRTGVEARPAF